MITGRIPTARIVDDVIEQARQSHARAEDHGVTAAEAQRVLLARFAISQIRPYATHKPLVDRHRAHGAQTTRNDADTALLTPYAMLVPSYPNALSLRGAIDRASGELHRTVAYAVATALVAGFEALRKANSRENAPRVAFSATITRETWTDSKGNS